MPLRGVCFRLITRKLPGTIRILVSAASPYIAVFSVVPPHLLRPDVVAPAPAPRPLVGPAAPLGLSDHSDHSVLPFSPVFPGHCRCPYVWFLFLLLLIFLLGGTRWVLITTETFVSAFLRLTTPAGVTASCRS